MALQVHSQFEFRFLPDEQATIIDASGVDSERIATDESNATYRAFRRLFETLGKPAPKIHITSRNGIPVERGLGGSGAAILGGLLAAAEWLNAGPDEPLNRDELLRVATELDGHPDNVCPSLLGGLRAAALDGETVHTLAIPCSEELRVVVAVPDLQVSTKKSRALLPSQVPTSDAVFNLGRLAILVAAFATFEYSYLGIGMQDRLHQPYRGRLIPALDAVFDGAMQAGASGVALSGSGPSVVAFCTHGAESIGGAMQTAFAAGGVSADVLVTGIDFQGTAVDAHY